MMEEESLQQVDRLNRLGLALPNRPFAVLQPPQPFIEASFDAVQTLEEQRP